MSAVEKIDFKIALEERYLAYAMSTIMSRSLPDLRDGLKPVHRRLLYAMLQLKLDPSSGFKKCARVVGDVIGKYHPHGDSAVYEAMVKMGQSFAARYPLILGQGNFGSIDGDNQAAMRYTEAKLTPYAMMLLQDIEYDTIDFKDNYDSSDREPIVLPAMVPNILANGSEGIAVGMATSIPPHNLQELLDACCYLIDHPNCNVGDITQFIKGPDLPTGGIIVDHPDDIKQAYAVGKGSFRVRAKWHKEELPHSIYQIVITQIPYQVQKRNIIEKMAELYNNKKLPFISNFQDMSAEDIRVIIEPKNRNIEPQILMKSLFKLTDLEVKIQLNLNVLDRRVAPKVMNIKEVLYHFLQHRKEVVTRKFTYRLNKINNRLEVLSGLLIAYINLDELINIIRKCDDAKIIIINKWCLTDLQAEAILNMKLRFLHRLEENAIHKENDQLSKEKQKIEKLLESDKKTWQYIAKQLSIITKNLDADLIVRRTQFKFVDVNVDCIDSTMLEKEPITVFYSKMGWIRTIKGHNNITQKYKEGDEQQIYIKCCNTDKLLCFSDYGKFYTLPCDKISGGKRYGDPLKLLFDMQDHENIINIMIYNKDHHCIMVSKDGKGFKAKMSDLLSHTKNGKQILNSNQAIKAIDILATDTHIALLGENRKLLIIALNEIPSLRKGKGNILQKYKKGGLRDILIINIDQGIQWQHQDNMLELKNYKSWIGNRGGAGKMVLSKLWIE